MSLLSVLIQKRDTRKAATAIPAISATQPRKEAGTVARIATVAVANPKTGAVVARVADCYHGLTLAELKEAAGEDWPDIEHDSKAMEALGHAIQTRRMREHGEVPAHYTATTLCARCGPVPIFPGCPETVLGCPWCFNRVQGLPVPVKAGEP